MLYICFAKTRLVLKMKYTAILFSNNQQHIKYFYHFSNEKYRASTKSMFEYTLARRNCF